MPTKLLYIRPRCAVTMKDIRQKAKDMGLSISARMKKVEAVRLIQEREGNTPCYMTGVSQQCGQDACSFRNDCE